MIPETSTDNQPTPVQKKGPLTWWQIARQQRDEQAANLQALLATGHLADDRPVRLTTIDAKTILALLESLEVLLDCPGDEMEPLGAIIDAIATELNEQLCNG